jgi:glucan phosphoethanolaminetransferase (alkaline phosphatase superfamily)
MVGDFVNVDYLHFNPHRTQSDAASIPFIFIVIFSIIALFGVALTFICSQILQAFLAKRLVRKYGVRGLYGVILSIPLLAVVSWYCYDYLTPSDFNLGMNLGRDWTPYQHGLTMSRYTVMLGFQSFVTLLCLARLVTDRNRPSIKISLILVFLIIASIIGFVYGFMTAHPVQ